MGARTRKTTSIVVLAIALVMIGSTFLALAGFAAPGAAAAPALTTATGTSLSAAPISPSPISLDYGQSFAVKVSAGGGTPGYYYNLYDGPFASCSADIVASGGHAPTYTPIVPTVGPQPGSYTFGSLLIDYNSYLCYSVTDSETPAVTVNSTTDFLTVNTDLSAGLAVTVPIPAASIDAGQPVTISATPSGGTPPYTYEWFSGSASGVCDTNQMVNTTETVTVFPTTSLNYCYSVTDSSQGISPVTPGPTSSTQPYGGPTGTLVAVTVYNALTAPAPTTPASPATELSDAGLSVTISSPGYAAMGGSGIHNLALQWYNASSAAACSDGHGNVMSGQTGLTVTDYPQVTTFYCYSVTDIGITMPETVFSAAVEVEIAPALTPTPIAVVGTAVIDASATPAESVTLFANATGGVPSLVWSWYDGPYASCLGDVVAASPYGLIVGATAQTLVVSPTVSTYYCFGVHDSLGSPATNVYSGAVLVTVDAQLTVGSVTPIAPLYLDDGQSITLHANPSGGTGTYTYQWFSYVASCNNVLPGQNGPTLTVSPIVTTEYCYTVTDNSNGTLNQETVGPSATVTVTVEHALEAIAPATVTGAQFQDPPAIVTLSATYGVQFTGGYGLYSFQWYNGSSPTKCTTKVVGQTASTYTDYPQVTTYYCVAISDSSIDAPVVITPAAAVYVNAPLVSGPLFSLGQVEERSAGQSIELIANPSGGSFPYTFAWYYGSFASCAFDLNLWGQATYDTHTPFVGTGATPLWEGINGTAYICYSVMDSLGTVTDTNLTTGLLVTSNPAQVALAPVGPVAPPWGYDVGAAVTLTADQTGGVGPYTYQWFIAPAHATACADTDTLIAGAVNSTFTAHPPGSVTTLYCYRVTDSSAGGVGATDSAFSPTFGITVNAPLTAPLAAGDCALVTAGGTPCSAPTPNDVYSLTVTPTGGAGTSPGWYTIQWYTGTSSVAANDLVKIGTNSTTLDFTYTGAAYYCYTVTDANGVTVESPTLYVPT